jgi:ubiquinone/menaquinone biosynthesis C-methylase UbiE
MNTDYMQVTEMPGNKVSKENLRMLYTRYKWASEFIKDKIVLEVACGPGIGLGYLAKKAKKVIGSDYDANLVKIAKNYYKDKIDIFQSDAQCLPFKDNSFDVVILFEAIYYLPHPEKFLSECKRILRKDGIVLICTVNKDWEGFNPSPFSVKYFSVPELTNLFKTNNFEVELLGNFPADGVSFMDKYKLLARKMAVSLHIMPKTMKGKEKLKRIFYGKLVDLPNEIKDEKTENPPFEPIDKTISNQKYKVIYAMGRLK